jgi:hypothetical protein
MWELRTEGSVTAAVRVGERRTGKAAERSRERMKSECHEG